MSDPTITRYVHVNGLDMYWESRGDGGAPLVVVHGGFGLAGAFGDLLDRLATSRRVIAIELQGHGHTRDIDRPFSYEAFGDDIAGIIDALGLEPADLFGYSWGRARAYGPLSNTPTASAGWHSCRSPAAETVGSRRSGKGCRKSAAPGSTR
jgi:pimeloyl-ACP methyl ester carboxylesterase